MILSMTSSTYVCNGSFLWVEGGCGFHWWIDSGGHLEATRGATCRDCWHHPVVWLGDGGADTSESCRVPSDALIQSYMFQYGVVNDS